MYVLQSRWLFQQCNVDDTVLAWLSTLDNKTCALNLLQISYGTAVGANVLQVPAQQCDGPSTHSARVSSSLLHDAAPHGTPPGYTIEQAHRTRHQVLGTPSRCAATAGSLTHPSHEFTMVDDLLLHRQRSTAVQPKAFFGMLYVLQCCASI